MKAELTMVNGEWRIRNALGKGQFRFIFFMVFLLFATLSFAQRQDKTTVRNILQGAWMMDADTNAVLIFSNDTITLRMRRTAGKGNGTYIITSTNCNPGRFSGDSTMYINETYTYMQYGMPYSAMLCYKILEISAIKLKLQKEDIIETYTKFAIFPKFK
jgi:hypothetical protein